MIRALMIIYLLIGLVVAGIIYYLIINDDDNYEDRDVLSEKSSIAFIIFFCTCFWIVLLPLIIYNSLKEEK